MTLTIVIVSYNARADLENCLASLQVAPPAITHEVVVVDNASPDRSAEAVRARFPAVKVIALDRNVGFAAGNNAGLRATAGDLVLLLNSDTLVSAGAIDRLVQRLQAHPDAAVAGPRLLDGQGRTEISWGSMISPFGEFKQKTIRKLYDRQFAPVERSVARAASTERYVDWVSGACLLVYRRDADAVGLLDERFFLYTEDVDFCASIRARGRRVLFVPSVAITHLRGRSRATAPATMNVAYRRSQLAFYEKHHPGWAPLLKLYLTVKGELPAQTTPNSQLPTPKTSGSSESGEK
jgi:GT2 family glycosyltransferase